MYINEQAHTKQELALIKQLKEFCDQNNIELDYGGRMTKPGTFKSYNTFQKGADLIYDNYKLGRMSFRQGPNGLVLFLAVEELYVNNSISEHVASIKLVSESNTRVKTFSSENPFKLKRRVNVWMVLFSSAPGGLWCLPSWLLCWH